MCRTAVLYVKTLQSLGLKSSIYCAYAHISLRSVLVFVDYARS